MSAPLLQLNSGDFLRGLVVAVLATAFAQLATALNTPGFDILTFDWTETVKIAFASGVGYISKNFLTDANGKFLGSI